MTTVMGVLALTIGLALIVIAALGTQGQVFQALTLRTAPGGNGPTTRSGPTTTIGGVTVPSTSSATVPSGGPVTSV